MNTTEFKVQLIEDYGLYYSKADVLEALATFIPLFLFDMVCESGLKSMIADIQEYIACYMMEQQGKELSLSEESYDVADSELSLSEEFYDVAVSND